MAPVVNRSKSQFGTVIMYPERGEGVFTLAIILAVITATMLLLRLWSRALLPKRRFRSDDWMAVAAWPFTVGVTIQTCLLLRHGFGRHIEQVLDAAPANVTFILQVLYSGYLTYTIATALVRISVGLFYGRLFSIAVPGFEWQVHANTTLNIMYMIGLSLASAFECTPVSAFWDKSIPGAKCIPTLNIQLASVVPSVVLDLVALVMPLPIIWKMHLSHGRKALLLVTFVLGYSVIVLSVGRLVTIAKIRSGLETDLTCEFADPLPLTSAFA
ncbi:hypothetical protein NX059_001906 [Plenodomus lindquistii]|nr:hypothetical protein NX059_001906 [Plenodomus lindquistii]